jgi:hypothetical protein
MGSHAVSEVVLWDAPETCDLAPQRCQFRFLIGGGGLRAQVASRPESVPKRPTAAHVSTRRRRCNLCRSNALAPVGNRYRLPSGLAVSPRPFEPDSWRCLGSRDGCGKRRIKIAR